MTETNATDDGAQVTIPTTNTDAERELRGWLTAALSDEYIGDEVRDWGDVASLVLAVLRRRADTCTVSTLLDYTDDHEDCPACASVPEHAACPFHLGVDAGYSGACADLGTVLTHAAVDADARDKLTADVAEIHAHTHERNQIVNALSEGIRTPRARARTRTR